MNTPRARILIVDDHPNTALTFARAISQLSSNLDVAWANSGKAALASIDEQPVDILITDMMMPDMNGLELIETLRSRSGRSSTYTILITAYDVPGLRESAKRLQVNQTVIKPVRPEALCRIVSNVLAELERIK